MTKPYWQQRQEMKLKATTGMASPKGHTPEKKEISQPRAEKQAQVPKKNVPARGKMKKNGRTKKLAKIMRALKKTYPAFLERNPVCKIQSPVCTYHATVVNHEKGRGIKVVMNPEFWTPCCPPCNGYIEIHNEWAEKRGFKKSRLAIDLPKENNSENIC